MPRIPILAGTLLLALGSSLGLELFAQNDLPACFNSDCDCDKHFTTWQEAKRVFDAAQPGDPHRLDQDKDGIPCENLPGAPTSGSGSTPQPTTPSPVTNNPPPNSSPDTVANNPPPPPTTSSNQTASEESSAVPALW